MSALWRYAPLVVHATQEEEEEEVVEVKKGLGYLSHSLASTPLTLLESEHILPNAGLMLFSQIITLITVLDPTSVITSAAQCSAASV